MITGPEEIAQFADDPSIVVFSGTVISVRPGLDNMGHSLGTLAVDLVFKGELPSSAMPVVGGGGGDCTISIEVGQRMITAAQFDRGAITPGLCMPYGDPTTPDGQRLLEEATRAYGPGVRPPDAPPVPTDPPASPSPVGGDLALSLVLGVALAVVVAMFGIVALIVRRGKPAG